MKTYKGNRYVVLENGTEIGDTMKIETAKKFVEKLKQSDADMMIGEHVYSIIDKKENKTL